MKTKNGLLLPPLGITVRIVEDDGFYVLLTEWEISILMSGTLEKWLEKCATAEPLGSWWWLNDFTRQAVKLNRKFGGMHYLLELGSESRQPTLEAAKLFANKFLCDMMLPQEEKVIRVYSYPNGPTQKL